MKMLIVSIDEDLHLSLKMQALWEGKTIKEIVTPLLKEAVNEKTKVQKSK